MTHIPEIDDLKDDIGWARFWLEVPDADLPGALTREKVAFVLDQALIDMQRYYGASEVRI